MSLLSTLSTAVTETHPSGDTLTAKALALVTLLAAVCAVAGAGALLAVVVDQRGDGTEGAYSVALVLLAVFVVALVLLVFAITFAAAVGADLPLI